MVGNTADAHISFDGLLEQFDAIYLGPGRISVLDLDLGLELNGDGTIRIDPETLSTSNPKVFSGGSHRQPKEKMSLIGAVCDGRSAMISMDRFLQGASLTASRANEGARSTRLFTGIEGVAPQAVTPAADPLQGYTREEAVLEAERCLDCNCLECFNLCEYMRHYKTAPRLLALQIFKNIPGVGGHRYNQKMNSCSLCRQCEAVCRDKFSMADICRAAREALVKKGKMPPSAFGFAIQDMEYSGSDAFALARHEPGRSASYLVFYPGCQLSGSAPWQVEKIYSYLRGKVEGGVGLMLGCCGVQADWAGEKDRFLETLEGIRSQWADLGKPVMALACPTCYMVFKQRLPEIAVEFMPLLLERLGLPEFPASGPRTLAVHDSCTTRYEKEIQDSIRRILGRLGHTVEELKTSRELTECCGFGGLMQISNRRLAHQVVDRRIGASDSDYLVYCSMCRDNFANRGKATYHLLDLLFGDESGKVAARPPVGYSRRHDNRARLKARMLREIWGEDAQEGQAPPALRISPQARAVMEDSLILDTDVQEVIAYAESTGNRLKNRTNGHFIACCKPAHVTYWVEYTAEEGAFTVYDAYCHRLTIVEDKGGADCQLEDGGADCPRAAGPA
jgi:Fe-S oxidoreductase